MTKVVVSDKALREMVAEVLDNTGWSGEENSPAVVINPVTDPSVAVTDPVNANYTPQNKTEFGVAMGHLVRNLPDSDMPNIYRAVKKSLDQRSEKDEMDAAEQAAMVGGSQEAIDANMGRGKTTKHKQEGKTMSTEKNLEESLRQRIRGIIMEVLQEAGELPPVKKIPFGVHGAEYMRRQEKTKAALRKSLGKAVAAAEAPEEEEPDLESEPSAEAGEAGEAGETGEEPKRHAYKPTAIGGVSDVGGKSFDEIAKELDFSVAGAKQAVDKAMLRFGFLMKLPEDEREIMTLTAMSDYIDMLNKTGELTAADVQLLKDHPDIVRELDGFREFFHNTVRRAMKSAKAEDEELGEADEPNLDEDDEPAEIKGTSVAEPPKKTASTSSAPPKSSAPAKMASGKTATVDWGGFDEARDLAGHLLQEAAAIVLQDRRGPYVIADGVEARPTNPNQTQYRAGSKVNVHRHGKKGVFIVEMPNGEKWTNVIKESPRRKTR